MRVVPLQMVSLEYFTELSFSQPAVEITWLGLIKTPEQNLMTAPSFLKTMPQTWGGFCWAKEGVENSKTLNNSNQQFLRFMGRMLPASRLI